MGKLFKRGYDPVRQEKQRQDERKAKLGSMLWRFFLTDDGDEAQIRFITENPVTFYEHNVPVTRNGKKKFDSILCLQDDDCTLCADGDTPSFKGAYLIYDMRPYEVKDQNGKKKTVQGQLRLYVAGQRVLLQLDRLSQKYGLTNREYVITRCGSGTSTTYTFDREEKSGKLSKAEITNLLPENLREMYNGTEESLYNIIEDQLKKTLPTEDDDDEDEPKHSKSRTVSSGDDDEDDEEEPPKKTKSATGKSTSKSNKLTLNSKKSLVKSGKSVKGLFKKNQKDDDEDDDDGYPF